MIYTCRKIHTILIINLLTNEYKRVKRMNLLCITGYAHTQCLAELHYCCWSIGCHFKHSVATSVITVPCFSCRASTSATTCRASSPWPSPPTRQFSGTHPRSRWSCLCRHGNRRGSRPSTFSHLARRRFRRRQKLPAVGSSMFLRRISPLSWRKSQIRCGILNNILFAVVS